MVRTLTAQRAREVVPGLSGKLKRKGDDSNPDFEVLYKVKPTVVLKVSSPSHFLLGHHLSRKDHVALVKWIDGR
jgi:hypothetical protein